jgi:hypothetical protein
MRAESQKLRSLEEAGALYFFVISDLHVRLFYRESKELTQLERFLLPS